MLFNEKYIFYQFPMLFNGNLRLEMLGGDVMLHVHNDSPLCPTGHCPFCVRWSVVPIEPGGWGLSLDAEI